MSRRKICVFTGTRADYGLLKPLMEEIQKQPEFELQIVASCMHLSPEFGLTYQEIEKDGFKIDEKVEMLLSSDTPIGTVKSMGVGMIGYADALNRLKPDLVIVLGDRFEALAFALSAYILRIPIAHLYGGEATYGLIDEGIRHSITKLSYLHFTSTEEYRKRVIQMGESPDRVFNVGALGIDNIKNLRLLSKAEIENKLNLKLKKYNYLFTYHPLTLNPEQSEKEFKSLLDSLIEYHKSDDFLIIFTYSNADPEGRKINRLIDGFVEKNKDIGRAFKNLGYLNYLSVMQFVDAVVGNSSSGIIEAPSLGIPTINIGDRQKGRIRAESVIDVVPDKKNIIDALSRIHSKDFRYKIKNVKNPYGDGNASKRIVGIIKKFLSKSDLSLMKEFYKIPC